MIFYYLNKKTNKWSQVNIDQSIVDTYKINSDKKQINIPNHEGIEVPVLDFIGQDENDAITIYAKGAYETRPVIIPIIVREINTPANEIDGVDSIRHPNYIKTDLNDEPVNKQPVDIVLRTFANRKELPGNVGFSLLESEKTRINDIQIDTTKFFTEPIFGVNIENSRKNFKEEHRTAPKKVLTFNEKVEKLTTTKAQRSKYFSAKGNKNVIKYFNRDGLAVRIEKKFGGGYIKQIGLGFGDDGKIAEVLGTKKINFTFKNSFGAKLEYTADEQTKIEQARAEHKNIYRKENWIPDHGNAESWDASIQCEKRFVKTKINLTSVNSESPFQEKRTSIVNQKPKDINEQLPITAPTIFTPKLTNLVLRPQ